MKQIKSCIDGKNGENVLEELGVRLHGIIYEHLLQFSYNSAGMLIFSLLVLFSEFLSS